MTRTSITGLSIILLFATTSLLSAADEITITHRSGKVQTIKIEQPDDPVDQVSFKPGRATAEPVSSTPSAKQQGVAAGAAAGAVTVIETKPAAKQPAPVKAEKGEGGVKIKWAQPMDAGY